MNIVSPLWIATPFTLAATPAAAGIADLSYSLPAGDQAYALAYRDQAYSLAYRDMTFSLPGRP